MLARAAFHVMVISLVFAAPASSHPKHDLMLINGRIYTANPERPRVEAVLIQDGTITALGKTDVILKKATPGIRIVDLAGRAAIADGASTGEDARRCSEAARRRAPRAAQRRRRDR